MTQLAGQERNAHSGRLELLGELKLLGRHLDGLVQSRGFGHSSAHLGAETLEVTLVAGLLEHS